MLSIDSYSPAPRTCLLAELWVAILLTIVFVVALVCAIERWDFMGGGKYAEEPPESVQEKMFLTIGTSMMVGI